MANWCNNTVTFTGSEKALDKLKLLFNQMADKQCRERKGQLPDFVSDTEGYFFDMYWNEGGEPVLHYETKWQPNTGILVKVAVRFGVGFEYTYDELGCCLYGEAAYVEGVLTEASLKDEDFEEFTYNEQTGKWIFEGEEYESDFDILEILLERRKQLL